MTKSRTLPALFLLVVTGPLPAIARTGPPQDAPPLPQPGTPDQPTIVTADEAIAMDRARMHTMIDWD